jgi:glycosyltransferase involved in cell wall biosynthesis
LRDPWSQIWGSLRWLKRWFHWRSKGLEDQVYRHAAAIITNTPGNLAQLRRQYPAYAEKMVTIPNGFDPEDLMETRGPALRDGNTMDETLHFLYLGGLRGEGFETPVLKVLASLLQEHPEERRRLRVHFVGGTPEQVEALVKPFGLADICRGYGLVSVKAVARPLAEADVYVLLLPEESVLSGWIPSKLYYYLAGGKYIFALVPEGSAKNMLLGLGDIVEVANPGDLLECKIGLSRIINRAREAPHPGPRGTIPDYARPYDRRQIAREVAAVLDNVASGRT